MHLRSLALLFLFSEQTRGFAPSIVCTQSSCKETVSKTFLSSSNSLESESSTVELEAQDIASVENVSNLDQEFEEETATEEVIEDASNVDTKTLDLLKEELISKASPQDSEITASPHLTFDKYLTMQEKRVHVTIKCSENPFLRPYYLTVAQKIKEANPDVIVERVMVPHLDKELVEDSVFEIVVDGKVVIGKSQTQFLKVRRSSKDEINNNNVFGMSVYVSMEDLNIAISKARKKRRPTTSYVNEDRNKAIRLELLKDEED